MKKRWFRMTLSAVLILSLMTSCKRIEVFQKGKATDANGEEMTWDEYTEDFFVSSITEDALTMHYFIQYPENFGIDEYEDTLGTIYSEEPEEDQYTWASDALKELEAYPDSTLTDQQKLDKETLTWYLETEKMGEDEKFAYYNEYAAPMYGVQSNLPINFANYAFNEPTDVDHYLALLDDVPRYMNELFLYEQEKANRGYGMADYLIDQVIEECSDFLGESVEDNVLVTTFDERIDSLNLESGKAEEYKASNLKKVEESVFPAYQDFMSNMETLKGMCKGSGALPEFEHGKEYFEYLARGASSSDRTVEELKELLQNYIDQQYGEITMMAMADPDLLSKMDDPDYGAEDPVDILELIASRMGNVLVPDIGSAKYTVRYVPKSLEGSSNPAFCFIPQIDNVESAIYINQSPEYEHMDFFITVAHEGYPGHMYQNTYYYGTDPAHFRYILDFSGYTEGWAVYISYRALELSDIEDASIQRLLALDSALGYEFSALADIGVNYEGWTQEELADFFEEYGLSGGDIEDLYYQLISTPGVYLSYSAAACEIWDLQKYAMEKLGEDYNDVDFHRIILDAGPTSFSILKERVDEFAASRS